MAIRNKYFNKEEIGKVRTAQEDSHNIALNTQNGDLYVVCDGMGGHIGGKQASSIAVDSILNFIINNRIKDPTELLNEALQFANENILKYSMEHPELRGMGTTACILLFKDDDVYIAHVGDSRIYLYLGKEKQLHRITKDHSFVQTLVDAGEITDEEAEKHPNKNRILKALGVHPVVKPTICSTPVHPKKGDIFLLCSDGLCGMINDTAIESVLSSDLTLEEKGNTLTDLALKAGGHDNITVELAEVLESPYKKSEFTSFNPQGRPKTPTKSNKSNKLLLILPAVFNILILACIITGGYIGWKYLYPKYIEWRIDKLEIESNTLKDKISKEEKDYNTYNNSDNREEGYKKDSVRYKNSLVEQEYKINKLKREKAEIDSTLKDYKLKRKYLKEKKQIKSHESNNNRTRL